MRRNDQGWLRHGAALLIWVLLFTGVFAVGAWQYREFDAGYQVRREQAHVQYAVDAFYADTGRWPATAGTGEIDFAAAGVKGDHSVVFGRDYLPKSKVTRTWIVDNTGRVMP